MVIGTAKYYQICPYILISYQMQHIIHLVSNSFLNYQLNVIIILEYTI